MEQTNESFEAEKMAFYAFINENGVREEAVKMLKYVLQKMKKKKLKTPKQTEETAEPKELCETTSLEIIKKAWQTAQTKGLSQQKFTDRVSEEAQKRGIEFKRKFSRGVLSNILNNTKKPYEDVANFLNTTNIKY